MRLDRWLALGALRVCGAVSTVNSSAEVPVLMYHSISDDTEPQVKSYYKIVTNPKRFAEQMAWLAELGYRGVSLRQALTALKCGDTLEQPLVAITFDDGFQDFYLQAWPALAKCGFTATMYLPTGFIGSPSRRRWFRGRPCLTWSEVRELSAQGVQFGSHTVSHPKLYQLSWREIAEELRQSKDRIEQELRTKVNSFAYPYAYPQEDIVFSKRIAEMLCEQGYEHCATTIVGRMRADDDPFRMKRLPANSDDDRALFAAKLAGAYDWMGKPQAWLRRVRLLLRPAPLSRRNKSKGVVSTSA